MVEAIREGRGSTMTNSTTLGRRPRRRL